MNKEQDFFIKRLIELLEERNMTQIQLAKEIDVTNVTISRYLSGERSPRIEIVSKIAKYFSVSVDYLLGHTDVKQLISKEEFEKNLLNSEFVKKYAPLTEEQKKTLNSLIEVWEKEKGESK